MAKGYGTMITGETWWWGGATHSKYATMEEVSWVKEAAATIQRLYLEFEVSPDKTVPCIAVIDTMSHVCPQFTRKMHRVVRSCTLQFPLTEQEQFPRVKKTMRACVPCQVISLCFSLGAFVPIHERPYCSYSSNTSTQTRLYGELLK